MNSSARFLGVTVALSNLIVLATGGKSLAAPMSDELKVLRIPTGDPLYDQFIPETPGAGTESSALFAALGGGPNLVPSGGLSGFVQPGVPGANYVILSEPPNEPVDPNELPPITFNGPNGPVVVSDLLINGFRADSAIAPFVALISDSNPDLALYLAQIPANIPVIVQETGALQDLTPFIGNSVIPGVGPVQVMVQSDVITVPEPSSIVILLGFAGVGLIGIVRHHVGRRSATGPIPRG
jgi:hypothetical protein